MDVWQCIATILSSMQRTSRSDNYVPYCISHSISCSGICVRTSISSYQVTFPEIDTSEFVYGICVVGASSAIGISTDISLTYSEVLNFQSGQTAWSDRSYTIEGVENTICVGGIFLQPSKHKVRNENK